jgi:hypothetical protein
MANLGSKWSAHGEPSLRMGRVWRVWITCCLPHSSKKSEPEGVPLHRKRDWRAEMKTYLVSEEVLRQVLEIVQTKSSGDSYLSLDEYKAIKQVEILLAKEPSEPVAWAHKTNSRAVLRSVGDTMETDKWEPLFRKDA